MFRGKKKGGGKKPKPQTQSRPAAAGEDDHSQDSSMDAFVDSAASFYSDLDFETNPSEDDSSDESITERLDDDLDNLNIQIVFPPGDAPGQPYKPLGLGSRRSKSPRQASGMTRTSRAPMVAPVIPRVSSAPGRNSMQGRQQNSMQGRRYSQNSLGKNSQANQGWGQNRTQANQGWGQHPQANQGWAQNPPNSFGFPIQLGDEMSVISQSSNPVNAITGNPLRVTKIAPPKKQDGLSQSLHGPSRRVPAPFTSNRIGASQGRPSYYQSQGRGPSRAPVLARSGGPGGSVGRMAGRGMPRQMSFRGVNTPAGGRMGNRAPGRGLQSQGSFRSTVSRLPTKKIDPLSMSEHGTRSTQFQASSGRGIQNNFRAPARGMPPQNGFRAPARGMARQNSYRAPAGGAGFRATAGRPHGRKFDPLSASEHGTRSTNNFQAPARGSFRAPARGMQRQNSFRAPTRGGNFRPAAGRPQGRKFDPLSASEHGTRSTNYGAGAHGMNHQLHQPANRYQVAPQDAIYFNDTNSYGQAYPNPVSYRGEQQHKGIVPNGLDPYGTDSDFTGKPVSGRGPGSIRIKIPAGKVPSMRNGVVPGQHSGGMTKVPVLESSSMRGLVKSSSKRSVVSDYSPMPPQRSSSSNMKAPSPRPRKGRRASLQYPSDTETRDESSKSFASFGSVPNEIPKKHPPINQQPKKQAVKKKRPSTTTEKVQPKITKQPVKKQPATKMTPAKQTPMKQPPNKTAPTKPTTTATKPTPIKKNKSTTALETQTMSNNGTTTPKKHAPKNGLSLGGLFSRKSTGSVDVRQTKNVDAPAFKKGSATPKKHAPRNSSVVLTPRQRASINNNNNTSTHPKQLLRRQSAPGALSKLNTNNYKQQTTNEDTTTARRKSTTSSLKGKSIKKDSNTKAIKTKTQNVGAKTTKAVAAPSKPKKDAAKGSSTKTSKKSKNAEVTKDMPTKKKKKKTKKVLVESSSSSSSSSSSDDSGIPDEQDVCFEAEDHKGTEAFVKAIRKSLKTVGPVSYSPKVYRRIKKQLKDRRFFICDDDDKPFEWREVTKSELIDLFWKYYEEEKENYKTS